MLPQKPDRILRPTRFWDSNLSWSPDDVLQLTLGEEDVQWELKGSAVASMSIDDIKPTWKVLALCADLHGAHDGPTACRCNVHMSLRALA